VPHQAEIDPFLSGHLIRGQEQVIGQDAKIGDYYTSEAKFNQLKSCTFAPVIF
jgi:hypothetical protein